MSNKAKYHEVELMLNPEQVFGDPEDYETVFTAVDDTINGQYQLVWIHDGESTFEPYSYEEIETFVSENTWYIKENKENGNN
jgi:hypothetical protein